MRQSGINGMQMEISSRKRSGEHVHSWEIRTRTGTEAGVLTTETAYSFLCWDDLIREKWRKSFFAFVLDLFAYLYIYYVSGLIIRGARLTPPILKAALSPILYILFTLLTLCFVFDATLRFLTPCVPLFVALAVGTGLVYLLIRLSMHVGGKIAVFWLLRLYIFCGTYVSRPNAPLMQRIETFAAHIAETIGRSEEREVDEILIVAHSIGTVLAIPLLARVLEKVDHDYGLLRRVSVLTLGECIPLVSFLEEADDYRRQMRQISDKGLFWADFTSPIDQVCFALVDFYAESGVAVSEQHKPRYLSPRFHTLYHPETYSEMKKDIMTSHFMYLMSSDIPGTYDYFKITAGHYPLSSYTTKGTA